LFGTEACELKNHADSSTPNWIGGRVFFGLFSLWGMFEKTDSFLYGAYFDLAIGFIVFLMVTFLGGVIVVLFANFISYLQMLYYGRFNENTRRAYQ